MYFIVSDNNGYLEIYNALCFAKTARFKVHDHSINNLLYSLYNIIYK